MREVGCIYERLILKVMLHRTICNHAQHKVAMLEQCCVLSKTMSEQCCNTGTMLPRCVELKIAVANHLV